jgi:hypothetical protein
LNSALKRKEGIKIKQWNVLVQVYRCKRELLVIWTGVIDNICEVSHHKQIPRIRKFHSSEQEIGIMGTGQSLAL